MLRIEKRSSEFQTTFFLWNIIHRFCGCFGEIISLDYEQIREPCGIAQAQPISVHFPVIRKQFGGKF